MEQNERVIETMQGQLGAMKEQAAVGEYQADISAIAVGVAERNAKAAEISAQASERGVEVMKESYVATTRAISE